MDFFASQPQFNTISLPDLLKARDQFHPHLLHKANVVGTAIGRYLIRKGDPYPIRDEEATPKPKREKPPRTLENSEVREYSWPAVLVFVSEWVDEKEFGGGGRLSASDYVPKTIYLDDGRSIPICVVKAPLVETAPATLAPEEFTFPDEQIAGGYPVISEVQKTERTASIGCLLTDGHRIYALTNRHVAGRPNEQLFTKLGGKRVAIGRSSEKQIGRMPFEKVYDTWPGKRIYVNLDIGLIEVEDQRMWNPSVYGVGQLGPLADLSVYNLTLNLIGCPVRAYGCASGRLYGRIAALFYRYKSVGGFEYVADFLIGSRGEEPLLTRPGDSGTIWVVENDDVEHDLMPIAVQWGGTVFETEATQLPFALATNLSNVCRELEVELFRARGLASFEYWEAVGHYSVSSFACTQPGNQNLRGLMMMNRARVGFEPGDINTTVNSVTVPGFVPLANVPDKVWKKTYNATNAPYGRKGPENPNHYADIDHKPGGVQSLDELTPDAASLDPQTWRDYYDAVDWTADRERGLLPFRVWQIYKKMVEYVRDGEVTLYVAAAGVLAHYVGDACQTLHGSYLSDGDPFRFPNGNPSDQPLGHGDGYGAGIHSAYEGDMLDAHYRGLIQGLEDTLDQNHGMNLIQGGRNAGFAIVELMRRTRERILPMDLVETYGALVLEGRRSEARTVLWDQFGNQTIAAIADGCRTLAMIWESAWVEGGGNNIPENQLTTQSRYALKQIYNRQSFVRSVPLGPSSDGPFIDQSL
jgi:hypothetical protein